MKPKTTKEGKASPTGATQSAAQPGMAVTLGGAPISDIQMDVVKDIEMGGSGDQVSS